MRVKRSVHARKKRRKTLDLTKGYRGEALLMKLAEEVADLGVVEQRPNQDGRNMTMMLGPVKKKEPAQPKQGEQPAAEEPAPAQAAAQA